MAHGSLNVLVVEDDNEVREVVIEDLKSLGYQVTEAADGEAAWKIIKGGKKFDAILSDINMPHLDGMNFLKRLKEHSIETPLVFLTAYGEKERVLSALRFGAFDFLEKPYDFEVMKKAMDRATATGRLRGKISDELEMLMNDMSRDAEKIYATSRDRIIALKDELKLLKAKD